MDIMYKRELYSLPVTTVKALVEYAKNNNQKKSHIVAKAIAEYVKKNEEKQSVEDALSLIGMISNDSSDIQSIKASRY